MRAHTLYWASAYNRGLETLLTMWPHIRDAYPDASLHITYGWESFDHFHSGNFPVMIWKAQIMDMMHAPGITHHGRVGKQDLEAIRRRCGIWAYPSSWPETNCITALESQRDGVVPVTIAYGALPETVRSGVVIEGDITMTTTQERFLAALLELMGDLPRWEAEQRKGELWARQQTWDAIARQWDSFFTE